MQPTNKSLAFLRTPETRVRLRKIAAYFLLHGCNPVLSDERDGDLRARYIR